MSQIVRKILINVAPCFTRIAVLEDGLLAELHIESKSRRRLLGNIYLGRVTNVLSGIQAAFVDIGLKRDAFLYIDDITNPASAVYHDVENGDVQDSEVNPSSAAPDEHPNPDGHQADINSLVQPGQKIMVQITREPMEMKGARVTTHISLPGRFLVLMSSSQHTGISKRIESDEERERLRNLLEQLCPDHSGLIVRTAAIGISVEQFQRDVSYLENLWRNIQIDSKKLSAPHLLYRDLDAIPQVMRDFFDDSVETVLIDSEDDVIRCRDFVHAFDPALIDRIRMYNGSTPLFTRYDIENELHTALNRRVDLPSGGYLVFDDTEAMTVIDVNTGRYAGKNNLEETVLKTNLEAADAIARQVRLRDIGGIIVIDFIDMETSANRNQVINRLRTGFMNDRSKVNISEFSPLGLVEITRKRIKRSLAKTFLQTCPMCSGKGKILHPQAVAAQLIDEILQTAPPKLATGLEISTHASVKPYVDMCKARIIDQFENMGIHVVISEDDTCKNGQYQFTWL